MFLMERLLHATQTEPPQDPQAHEQGRQDWRKQRQLHDEGQASEIDNYDAIDKPVSESPDAGRSCYAFNDTFIDLRTPFDEKRGGITFAAMCFLAAPVGVGAPWAFTVLLPGLWRGVHIPSGDPLGVDGYLASIFISSLIFGSIAVAFYFGWRYLRLESFVQRRLLVRFNRKTRKVYLHRPAYAGGVVELNWDDCLGTASPPDKQKRNEAYAVGDPLTLYWPYDRTPHGHDEIVFVGRTARSTSELVNLWEFIRRYMQEGPQAVPRPRKIGRFPWPWRGIEAALALVWPLWRMSSLQWAVPLLLLASPALVLFAAGHWLSLLSCWEPVFPRALRQASNESFLAVVKARLIDLGAWVMLVAVIVAVVWAVRGG